MKYDTDHDYYQILGIDSDATEDEIKAAAKTKRREFHPDNYAGAGPEALAQAEEWSKQADLASYTLLNHRDEYDALRAKYIENYFDNLPPVLRLSTQLVDFGRVVRGATAPAQVVRVYNDGGTAEGRVFPDSGSFWTIEFRSAEDPDADWSELVVTCQVDETAPTDPIVEEAYVHMDGVEVSTKKLTIQVEVHAKPKPRATPTGTTAGTGPRVGTAGIHTCPACGHKVSRLHPATGQCDSCSLITPTLPKGGSGKAPSSENDHGPLKLLLSLLMFAGPFIVMQLAVFHGHGSVSSNDLKPWQDLVSLACGIWFFGNFVLIPAIWASF